MDKLTGGEYGFLLLTSNLGNPGRKPLTEAKMRELFERSDRMKRRDVARDVDVYDFVSIGYSPKFAQHVVDLLHDEVLLQYYLNKARKADCVPITRATENYPVMVRKRLGYDSPGVLWAKGDVELLETPMVSLVGSRDLLAENEKFAVEVGIQAAIQGYTLVSGNARGADKCAQNACLRHGGNVISVVADSLENHKPGKGMLYLSESSFDEPFTNQRAISRNRVIHTLGVKTFVAQSAYQTGGTWDGTVKNLRNRWSPVYGFADGSKAMTELSHMGLELIGLDDLKSFYDLPQSEINVFDR